MDTHHCLTVQAIDKVSQEKKWRWFLRPRKGDTDPDPLFIFFFLRFVVIPCCFYGLSGSRYQFPKGSPDGKYKAYQDYIRDVIDICDYELQTEVLRIPSTKNVALVGSERKKRNRSESNSVKVGLENEKKQRLEDAPEDDNKKEEEQDAVAVEERRKKRIQKLIDDSGLFVARISDKDKQELQKAKKAAALARPDK